MTVLRGHHRRRGYAMVLVVMTAACAVIISVTLLGSAGTTSAAAHTMGGHAQARQLAESGLNIVRERFHDGPDWIDQLPDGAFTTQLTLPGGTVTVSGTPLGASAPMPLIVDDHSFEAATGELANPAVAPPMSGVVGGWNLSRSASGTTGPTVPRIGVAASASATDGSNIAFVSFPSAVTGSGMFEQELVDELEPCMQYRLIVDVATGGLAAAISNFGFRVRAGGTVVAHAPDGSLLASVDLGSGFTRRTFAFQTSDAPPAGLISIELMASSIAGAASAVVFDNVRLETEKNGPVRITAVGRFEDTAHVIHADVLMPCAGGLPLIITWTDQQ